MPEPRWYKGNIHTHTTESDGDDTPENVVGWFRRHGYDFLVLSDHNHLTLFEYAEGRRKFKKPLLVPGEEVTLRVNEGRTAVHINAIGISRVVEPIDADGVVSTLQANVDAIVSAGGIASLNHPNFLWSFDHDDISQVTGATLLEIFNGHPATNVYGAPGKPSYEEIWDGVLSNGKAIFGVATDDSHHYKDFHPGKANPGRGWVVVRADELSSDAIVEGLASGDFYSSTGVELADLESSQESVSLRIEQQFDFIYTTSFVGRDGETLSEVNGLEASYQPRGDEGYVRATVKSSSGTAAWTQPVFLSG
ncbi:MAG: CehA/McbA family metallohydrolase [Chloroflexi bacterium]|nr:CehA/McbA family metallohydrolase [Chloroflexota bacterium]